MKLPKTGPHPMLFSDADHRLSAMQGTRKKGGADRRTLTTGSLPCKEHEKRGAPTGGP
jgi:hypothetical protein